MPNPRRTCWFGLRAPVRATICFAGGSGFATGLDSLIGGGGASTVLVIAVLGCGGILGAAGITTRGLAGDFLRIIVRESAALFFALVGGLRRMVPIGAESGVERDRSIDVDLDCFGWRLFGINKDRTDGCKICGTVGVLPS